MISRLADSNPADPARSDKNPEGTPPSMSQSAPNELSSEGLASRITTNVRTRETQNQFFAPHAVPRSVEIIIGTSGFKRHLVTYRSGGTERSRAFRHIEDAMRFAYDLARW